MKIVEVVKPKVTMSQIISEALNEGIISLDNKVSKLRFLHPEEKKSNKRRVKK